MHNLKINTIGTTYALTFFKMKINYLKEQGTIIEQFFYNFIIIAGD